MNNTSFPFPTDPKSTGKGVLVTYVPINSGAGASTLACLHAMANSRMEPALIDFNPAGKVRTYMGLHNQLGTNLLNIEQAKSPSDILAASLEHPTGVRVIPGISRILEAPRITAEFQLKACGLLKKQFDLSIAVLGSLTGPSWITLMVSDLICLVVTPNRNDIDLFSESMEYIARLGAADRTQVILNQSGKPSTIKTEDAYKEFMKPKVFPFNESLTRDTNRRKLVVSNKDKEFFNNLIPPTDYLLQADYSLVGILALRDGLQSANAASSDHQIGRDVREIIKPDDYRVLRDAVQKKIKEYFTLESIDTDTNNPVLREKFNNDVRYTLREIKLDILETDIPKITQKLYDNLLGNGCIGIWLNDPEVSDIMINGTQVIIDRKGEIIYSDESFEDAGQVIDLVRRMIGSKGKTIDRANPRVKCSLPDGSRLIALMDPATPMGAAVTIRRFRQDIDAQAYINKGSCSRQVMAFNQASVWSRMNIIVAGGTSSAKTTTLNILSSFIQDHHRVVTVENPCELQLQVRNWARLEYVYPNMEGKGEVTMAHLVEDAMKMRPDRVVVGECVGPEAYYMIQAMNTGHPGSMTTLHANSASDAMGRLADLVSEGSRNLTYHAIYSRIAGAVNFVIYMKRFSDGLRRIDEICEVVGPEYASDHTVVGVKLNPLWKYNEDTHEWDWVAQEFYHAKALEREGWRCPV